MCLIAFAYRSHPRFPLIVAANRDEYFARPTEAAGFWPEHPQVLAGRDGLAHGTWLGVTQNGRFSALTNYRAPGQYRADAKSRGGLVADFLTGTDLPAPYLEALASTQAQYNPFNLLVGSEIAAGGEFAVLCHGNAPERLGSGVYALSNAALDTPWPKVVAARGGLRKLIDTVDPDETGFEEGLWELLADETRAADNELPDTGISLELERALSAAHIRLPHYGTRSATILIVESTGAVQVKERSFSPDKVATDRSFKFQIAA